MEFHGEQNIRSKTYKVLSLLVQRENVSHPRPGPAPKRLTCDPGAPMGPGGPLGPDAPGGPGGNHHLRQF